MKKLLKKSIALVISIASLVPVLAVPNAMAAAGTGEVSYPVTIPYNECGYLKSTSDEKLWTPLIGWGHKGIDMDAFKTGDYKQYWKNEWTDQMTENTLSLSGYEFNMSVKESTRNEWTAPTGNQTILYAGDFTDDEWCSIKINEARYANLAVLASCAWETTSEWGPYYLNLKLNYADGTSKTVTEKMNCAHGTQNPEGWTGILAPKVGSGINWISITLHEFPVDTEKKLTSIDVLKSDYATIYAMTLTKTQAQIKQEPYDALQSSPIVNLPFGNYSAYITKNDNYITYLYNYNNVHVGIDIDEFKKMDLWANEWKDGDTQNKLKFNGYEFLMRVTPSRMKSDGTVEEDGIPSVVFAAADDSLIFDISADGNNYSKIALLAGKTMDDKHGSSGYPYAYANMYVTLNYADGTSERKKADLSSTEGTDKPADWKGIVAPATGYEPWMKLSPDKAYISFYEFDIDTSKTLESVSVEMEKAALLYAMSFAMTKKEMISYLNEKFAQNDVTDEEFATIIAYIDELTAAGFDVATEVTGYDKLPSFAEKTSNSIVMNNGGRTVSENTMTVRAELENKWVTDAVNGYAITALYDSATNQLLEVYKTPQVQTFAKGSAVTVSHDFDISAYKDKTIAVKCFVWNSFENMTPCSRYFTID